MFEDIGCAERPLTDVIVEIERQHNDDTHHDNHDDDSNWRDSDVRARVIAVSARVITTALAPRFAENRRPQQHAFLHQAAAKCCH